jgi:hypothetical protein
MLLRLILLFFLVLSSAIPRSLAADNPNMEADEKSCENICAPILKDPANKNTQIGAQCQAFVKDGKGQALADAMTALDMTAAATCVVACAYPTPFTNGACGVAGAVQMVGEISATVAMGQGPIADFFHTIKGGDKEPKKQGEAK